MNKKEEMEIRKVLDGVPDKRVAATTGLMRSLTVHRSRRQLLRSTMGLAVAGATAGALTMTEALHVSAVHAEVNQDDPDIIKKFFSILATGEALSATFYRLGIDNLGIKEKHQLKALNAILAEEELHLRFAIANGGIPANTFSFPDGKKTFIDRNSFLKTQQLIEELTNGALLAWIKDTASPPINRPDLAQIGGQLMQVEGGHRVVGRVIAQDGALLAWIKDTASPPINRPDLAQIGGQLMQVEGGHRVVGRVIAQGRMIANRPSDPWEDWGFGPVMLRFGRPPVTIQHFFNNEVNDVPAAVKAAGFLSPSQGNSFPYQQQPTSPNSSVINTTQPDVMNTQPVPTPPTHLHF